MRAKACQRMCMILFGSFVLAFSYYHINFQNHLAEGGFIGLALLGKYAFNFSPSLTVLALDIPIFMIAMIVKGRKFLFNTIVAATSFSFFYGLCERFSPLVLDFSHMMLVASILSGIATGYGAGIVLRYGAATGGDDILSLFLSKLSGLSIGTIFIIFDFVVLLFALLYLPVMEVLYTMIAVCIAGRVITKIYTPEPKVAV